MRKKLSNGGALKRKKGVSWESHETRFVAELPPGYTPGAHTYPQPLPRPYAMVHGCYIPRHVLKLSMLVGPQGSLI